jgi:hypothetical protein
VELPFSTASEGHRTAPSEAVECGLIPQEASRFVLSGAEIAAMKQVELPFSTALEGHRTAPSEAVECGLIPQVASRFVLSGAEIATLC